MTPFQQPLCNVRQCIGCGMWFAGMARLRIAVAVGH